MAVLASDAFTEPAAAAAATAPPGVRMLVIDDDARVRRVVTAAMARAGFHVLADDDGGPARSLAEHAPPDLALVDFHMTTPGLDVVRRLKAVHGAAIWIAVVTGRDDEAVRAASFAAGADDVIVKPIVIADLQRRMVAAARTQQAVIEARGARARADRLLRHGAEAAATLAHDLNNGLSVALCNAMYLQEVATLGDDEREALAATVAAMRRMADLVARFADRARGPDHPGA